MLKGVLPDYYFLHYTLLVTAIAILVSDRITPEQLKLAEELLDNFCKLLPELYGKWIFTFLNKLFIFVCSCDSF